MNFSRKNFAMAKGFVLRLRHVGFKQTITELNQYVKKYKLLTTRINQRVDIPFIMSLIHNYMKIVFIEPDIDPNKLLNIVPKWFVFNKLAVITNPPELKDSLVDKYKFYKILSDHGIQYPQVYLMYNGTDFLGLDENPVYDISRFENIEMFCKPRYGSGGIGARTLVFSSSSPQVKDTLFQEIVKNHHYLAEVSGTNAVTSLRINSYLTKNQEVEIASAFIKFPPKGVSTDNMSSGTFGMAIDIATGTLVPKFVGLTQFLPFVKDNHLCHPISNIQLDGLIIPYWEDVINMLPRLHKAFNKLRFIGWDIAITNHGPLIFEGNSVGDVFIEQMVCGPYFETKYIQENLQPDTK